jgi:DNA polymerase-3 subunit gamma/tau
VPYQSLYRRYRPQRFGDVRGQDHVTQTLRNAVRDGRVAHAYLFSGPRGTGKTSTARILAKALNCANPAEGEPCGVCESCVEIAEGRSLDVIELDAASNRGIDSMRELVARVSLGTPGRWKVYIVDEVHMLTTEAANTLLKTLEEPPGHVVFVLATTEPQKVLPTVQSRTQHFEFRLLPADVLTEYLRWVVADAGLDVAPEAIDVVARRGSGSARDALTALDQVAAGGVQHEAPAADELVEALCERDAGAAMVFVAEHCNAGHDPRQIARQLLEHLRHGFLAIMSRGLAGLPDEELARVESQARRLGPAAMVRAMETLGDALVDMREAPEPRIVLEVALVRLCRVDADVSPAALLERIERLERALASHERPPAAAGPGPSGASAKSGGAAAPPDEGASATAAATGPAAAGTAGARLALGGVRSSASGGSRAGSPAAPAPRQAPPPGAPPDPNPLPSTRPAPTTAAVATEGAAQPPFPSRDELTLAWGDTVLGQLPRRAAVRFQVGRFVAVEGEAAVFALPNAVHRDRCEEVRLDAERVLAEHFGRRVALRLIVESDVGAPPPAADPDPVEEETDVSWRDLEDAPEALASPVDHVLQAFEGAQVVEE